VKEIHLQCILADSNINFQLEERQFFNLVTFLYYSNIYIPDLESFSISERKLEQTLGGEGFQYQICIQPPQFCLMQNTNTLMHHTTLHCFKGIFITNLKGKERKIYCFVIFRFFKLYLNTHTLCVGYSNFLSKNEILHFFYFSVVPFPFALRI